MIAGPFFGGAVFGGGFFGPLHAGAARRRDDRGRFVVSVEGRDHVFSSPVEAIEFLALHETPQANEIRAKAEKDAARIIATGKKVDSQPPKVVVRTENAEVREFADEMQSNIDRAYWRALASALARQAEEDEDIAFIAGLDL